MEIPKHPLLNTPIFQTGLFIPKYKDIQKDNWKISRMGLGFDHGYFSDVWAVENMPILLRRTKEDFEKWETWMSICPHELESQELCCKYALGNVVVMGLGMGWVAINIAFNDNVKKVVVVEIDKEVIDIFYESGAMTDVPQHIQNKIVITNADAFNWKPEEKINLLYADIWQKLVEPQTLDDVRRMQNNINADKIYFWGQELFLFKMFTDSKLAEDNLNKNFLVDISGKIGLPMLLPDDADYPSMVIKAGKQRIKRGLPLAR
jgi:hypothetical protein